MVQINIEEAEWFKGMFFPKHCWTEVAKKANACGIEKITIGKHSILNIVDLEANEIAVIISVEPCALGQTAELKVLQALGQYEKKILLITTNEALKGISTSIHILSREERERIMQPMARHDWNAEFTDKTKNISMIYSGKKVMNGHGLRSFIFHKYYESGRIDFFTSLGQTNKHKLYENRVNSIIPYRYNIIIENTLNTDHVSEQLKDAILGKCIPLYFGGKNCVSDIIADIYGLNLDGIIDLRNKGLDETIMSIGEDFYKSSHDVINENHSKMKNKICELGWDGLERSSTSYTWLGDIVIQKIKNAASKYRVSPSSLH
ncbi:hypothetical protein N9L79_06440 [Alphaproteobacteria bacterium]|nr:hypothetical protein [Alphaproteobacteria bacterium]